MTIKDLREQGLIIFECISGSKAYGLDLPTSDIDIRGVFVLPKRQYYSLDYVAQVGDKKNDIVFYELTRFVQLLAKNNPNILELLNVSEEMIIYKHELFDKLKTALFLSKRARFTFAGYALEQIKKAKGLNKKIVNPIAAERKSILAFCYVTEQQGSTPLTIWLEKNDLKQAACGLVNIAHMKQLYALFYDDTGQLNYKGIMKKDTANSVLLSSIPKEAKAIAYLYFNQDGYAKYCKDYRDYWDWVEKRNESRYENTLSHGKQYDAKNMMHTFRLLAMAEEILTSGEIIVKRPDRDYLLAIRAGEFEYQDLVDIATEKIQQIDNLAEKCALPAQPNLEQINDVLFEIRSGWYEGGC